MARTYRRNKNTALCRLRIRTGQAAIALVCLLALQAPLRAALDAEKSLLAKGQYEEAITQLEAALSRDPDNSEAAALLLEARLETGEYRRALEQGEAFLKRREATAVAEKAAEAALRIGEYERAADLLRTVSTPQAYWLRGLLADRKGRRETARDAWGRLAAMAPDPAIFSGAEMGAIAAALAELGQFKEANQVYREAVRIAPDHAGLKVAWGNLFLQKHNPGEAGALYEEALESNANHPGALAGMAKRSAGRRESKAQEMLERALQVNPNFAEARLLLARMHMEREEYGAAKEELEKTLRVNPLSLEARSLRAVSAYLQGDAATVEQESIPRILSQNPAYGQVFADLGDFILLQRQFATAVDFYRRALEIDPDLSAARASLGINLFRLGKEQEARNVLEESYRRDPYNVWTVNTLRLMDSFVRFDVFETEHFAVKLHQKETALVRPYVEDLLEETLEDLSSRYGYKPDQKVVFEMYPDHEDFAVRTLGLPGLGALGASFGPVVAMDSPSARPAGTFHWGSTLWHEMAHVITLGLTSNRVPRWFTEGLSVYEENQARPGWGDPMTPATAQALQQNKLMPLEKLNGAFIRPQYPGQVQFAYFQAGMICEYIVETYGFPKILAMLHSYGEGKKDAEIIGEVLGTTLTEFDADFLAYASERTFGLAQAFKLQSSHPDRITVHAPGQTPDQSPNQSVDQLVEQLLEEVKRNPDNFFTRLQLAAALKKESKLEEAALHADAAKKLFPLFVDPGNPYQLLAEIYTELGQKEKAAAELLGWKENRGRNTEVLKELAALLKELGRTAEAIQTLEEALYISLSDVEIHNQLGEWHLETANPESAVREYRAVLALEPVDKAGAHYYLAKAYWTARDSQNARQEVLAALEIAPGYREAQKLLLEVAGK
ncbi:MAG: tetratricopeptide repeat protein [Acidobacteria bacterium]|nr:tetratricopeptide repeat protein [Acidobacteriota bacterium]